MTQRSYPTPFEGYRISEDCAVELLAHHLMMACRLYAQVPEAYQQVADEVERIMDEAEFNMEETEAAKEFQKQLWEMYEEMKKND